MAGGRVKTIPESNFCPLPWLALSLRNDGTYRICCQANTGADRGVFRDSDGNPMVASEKGLSEARNSSLAKEIRQSMMKGEWHPACARCKKEETAGLSSRRIYSREYFEDWKTEQLAELTEEDGTMQVDQVPLLDMDLRFGRECNLRCRMCGPSDSSAWATEIQKQTGRVEKTQPGFQWYESEQFWKESEPHFKTLRHLYIVGGEPLLLKKHAELLETLVKQGHASQITLEYNTNLTFLPESYLQAWKHFKHVKVGISLDGIFEVNDYIRHPSRFEKIHQNLRRLDEAEGNISMWLALTVSILNVWHVPKVMEWVRTTKWNRMGVNPKRAAITAHSLMQPSELSIYELPSSAREWLAVKFQDVPPSLTQMDRNLLQKYLNLVGSRPTEFSVEKFFRRNQELDQWRNQDFSRVAPEWSALLHSLRQAPLHELRP